MSIISLQKARAALVAGTVTVGALFLSAGASVTSPALAQQVTPVATGTVPPEIAREVDARLKQLAPIIRGAETERQRLGVPDASRDTCSARTGLYVKTVLALKNHETYSYSIARASMDDLEAMTRFAACTLPGGLQAKLNVCSISGIALSGKLMGPVSIEKLGDLIGTFQQVVREVGLT
ncbi:MAG: hypothetical protein KIS73_17775 [Enhydrobacter sp.]|nr:hypothetical protein [Enhydrobacter sp.]